MSYILEAIKRAENERGNKRLSQAVINDALDRSQEKKSLPWLAIAIFINALILLAWFGYKVYFDTPHYEVNVPQPTSFDSKHNAVKETNKSIQIVGTQSTEENVQIELKEMQQTESMNIINDEPVIPDNMPNELNESVRAALDGLEDQEAPAFFSLKKQHIESIELNNDNNKNISNIESESIKPFQSAKVEPIQQVEIHHEIVSVDDSADKDAGYKQTIQNIRTIPVIKHTNVPSYEELPYSLQKQIPKLTISVHIYNAEESARKVRINGQLLYEGEQIDNQTTIEEITPRGLIINYAGTLFRKNLH